MRRPSRRGLSALVVLFAFVGLVSGSLAACSGGSTTSDPYELLVQSAKAKWSPVQINMGLKATTSGKTVTLDPADIAIVIDEAAGKGAFHLSLDAASLEIPASSLAQLGITGSSIDLDIVDDGHALYAKSALFKPMLTMLLSQSGKLPAGDLTGWLNFGTNEQLAAFAAMAGAGRPKPSASAAAVDATTLKKSLDDAGVTLTLAGSEKHNGADTQHVKVAIDATKLANDPNFAAGAGNNYGMMKAALAQVTMSGDLWIDAGSKRLLEGDLHVAQTSGGSDVVDLTVTAKDPDGSVSLDGPSSSIDVPLQTVFSQLLQLMSGMMSS